MYLKAGPALGCEGPNAVLCKTCSVLLCILEQSRVANSSTGLIKASGPIGSNWSNWLKFSPTWNSQLLLQRWSWQQSYGSWIYIYLIVQSPSPFNHGMNTIQLYVTSDLLQVNAFLCVLCFPSTNKTYQSHILKYCSKKTITFT